MMSQLGGAVESTYLENIPENADAVRAIRKLADSGHDLIFTTSFNYMDQTLEVASEFPNVNLSMLQDIKDLKMYLLTVQDFMKEE
jgi:simple sugar transport system substrate-binding protein